MLTPDQLTAIDRHLREINLLTNEELILELTDHYTIALDERLAHGLSFETAITDVQSAFGGSKGLQKMERQYNRVTFRHYDERGLQALLAQFQKPLVGQTLIAVLAIFLFSWLTHKTRLTDEPDWRHFLNGTLEGALAGSSFVWLFMLWPYLKTIPFRGFHNVPTEVLYLLKRHILFLVPFYAVGSLGAVFLSIFPNSLEISLVALYLFIYYLFIRTSRAVYETLYEVDTAR
ncbi:hypothetical protein [Spirosoma agri]|uniref:Uncharacterized protein n=1 Tax=Spirosoma agri TaxID=1987381 RepID=A0A6M0ID48_9BACT|nr:hypothetical protein [Spirosoma agri]NEU65747.1 hypothetical protein [Spirosoma agri]